MKRNFTFLILSLAFVTISYGQICEPDPALADTTAGVYPPPFEAVLSPDGGIPDKACINQGFSFNFTVVVEDTIVISGLALPLDSIVLTGIDGLPEGINYSCNPGSCVFVANSSGCALLEGTPTAANTPGDYELVIFVDIYVNGGSVPIQFTFPNPVLNPGTYILEVLEEGDPNCTTGTNEVLAQQLDLIAKPNPTSGYTLFEINSSINEEMTFYISDLLGKRVYEQDVTVQEGQNQIEYNASDLSNGVYLYSITNGSGVVTKKIMINK